METLGQRIKRLRKKKEMSQRDLLEKSGLGAIAEIELDRRPNVEHDTLVAIAEALEVTLDELKDGVEVPENSRAAKRAKKVAGLRLAVDTSKILNLEDAIAILRDFPGFLPRHAVEMRGEYTRATESRSVRDWVSVGKAKIAVSKGKAVVGRATSDFDELPAKKPRK